ncbi:MAG: SpoIIE family protein phosphatase [Sporomusaceae bacterium]|nr:SpoIIE family protein phosphatase [Sporomusaceae bacterium]
MNRLYPEIAVAQLSKAGEELCGDKVEIARTEAATTVVISDGLGSGVKANILATLTTKITSSLLKRNVPITEVVPTITQTLPVCRERKIAYSTLQIIKLLPDSMATVVEFDSPTTFLFRGGQVVPFPTEARNIGGKAIREGRLLLGEGDIIVAVSDGVIHAGIGGLLKLGWDWPGISAELAAHCSPADDAEKIAEHILGCCNGYYLGQPGDDSTVVVIKLRRPRNLTLFTGPPANRDMDEQIVKRLMGGEGKKVVAGGTTANIVSRVLGLPVNVDLNYQDPEIPPIATIDNLDLVTEGVLTLTAAIGRLHDIRKLRASARRDGATLLARLLYEADRIDILAGTAVNPAHQNPNFPAQINIKAQVIANLRNALEDLGKRVTVEWV